MFKYFYLSLSPILESRPLHFESRFDPPGSKVIGRTASVLLQIARSSVGRRAIITTCDTDQQAIRSRVSGALYSVK